VSNINSFEMEQLVRLVHKERIRQGEDERLATRVIERESRGRRWWTKKLLLLLI
jgi:hypothetical protein